MQERLYYISELIEKQLNDNLSAGETVELNKWLNSSDANKKIYDQLHDEEFVKEQLEKFHRYDAEKNRAYLLRKLEESVSGESLIVIMKPKLWKRIAVAASIVGLLFVGYWLLRPSTTHSPGTDPSTVAQDVSAPDKNRAQIKLADGRIVYLDSAGNGELAMQGNVKLVKNANGEIVYETADDGPLTTVQYNTLFNPRGSKIQPLILDDGTKVWLNAESSITYPTAFVGNERRVEITGEAYFEVAKDAKKKFYVTGAGVTTEVLGTHFNVNAYDDENDIEVTLLEGSVIVKRNNESKLLEPGEQVRANPLTALRVNKSVDLRKVMAWKNGKFDFGDAANVEEIMRQVARWYDVEIVYERKISGQIGGSISRTVNVSQVLKMLALTDEVDFEIRGNQIIVR